MVLLSGPKGGIAGLSSEAVRTVTTAGGLIALFWWCRVWVMHVLDVVVAWARGLPAVREKNVYLKGAAAAAAAAAPLLMPALLQSS